MLDIFLRNGRSFLATNLFVPSHPAGPGVVFSHGWGGAHLFDDLHRFLSDGGIFVVSMEHRGFGRSPGTPSLAKWPEDVAAVGDWLRGRTTRVFAMGLSTGGTISLVAAGTYEWLAGAIALSPFASLKHIRRDYPPCKKILAARFGTLRPADYAAADALVWTPRIAPRPAIVAHARKDDVVPFAHAEMIRDRGGATLWEIAEGDHRLQSVDRSSLFKRIRHALLKA